MTVQRDAQNYLLEMEGDGDSYIAQPATFKCIAIILRLTLIFTFAMHDCLMYIIFPKVKLVEILEQAIESIGTSSPSHGTPGFIIMSE